MLARVIRSQAGSSKALCRCMSGNVPAQVLEHDDVTVTLSPGANAGEWKATPVSDKDLLRAYQDQQVQAVLAEEEEQETFFDAIGLSSGWTYGPMVAMGTATMVSNEWYVLNEETFVAMCLTGAGFIAYVNAREPFLAWYNEETKAIMEAQNDAEHKHISACQTFVDRAAGSPTLEADVAAAFAERASLVEAEVAMKAYRERLDVKKQFETQLEQLINKKADEENQLYKTLLADAEAHCAKGAQSKAFKSSAMAYAIQALTDPAKVGENPAGKLYKDFFASKAGIKW